MSSARLSRPKMRTGTFRRGYHWKNPVSIFPLGQRAKEEKRGLVRGLRPGYQIPVSAWKGEGRAAGGRSGRGRAGKGWTKAELPDRRARPDARRAVWKPRSRWKPPLSPAGSNRGRRHGNPLRPLAWLHSMDLVSTADRDFPRSPAHAYNPPASVAGARPSRAGGGRRLAGSCNVQPNAGGERPGGGVKDRCRHKSPRMFQHPVWFSHASSDEMP